MTKMESRCLPAIMRLLDQGWALDKHMAAGMVHCDQRTAQRLLAHIWLSGYSHIQGWTRENGAPIPVYLGGKGKDAPRPKAKTPAQIKREQRAQPAVRAKEAAVKRWNRQVSKVVKLGVFGL